MSGIRWGAREEADKAIHDAILSEFTSVPTGRKKRGNELEWNADGTLKTLKVYDGTKTNPTLLYTLDFEWNADGTLKNIWRTDA